MTQSNICRWFRAIGRRLYYSALVQAYFKSKGDWRYLYLPLTWLVTRLIVPRRKVKHNNVTLSLPCDNWITHFRWYLFSSKEPEILNYIDENMDETDIFFDIGANIGVFSLYAAKRHHGLKSYCFEPEFSNLHYLKNNIFENNLTEHIEVYSLAIGDHDGLSKLHIQDKTPGAAMHAENLEHIESTYEGFPVIWQEGIVSRTLDSLCLEMNVIPNVLKIDTDGNEFKILNGAPKILDNEKLRTIIMEVPLVEEFDIKCSQLLKSSGFKIDWEEKNASNRIWVREGG